MPLLLAEAPVVLVQQHVNALHLANLLIRTKGAWVSRQQAHFADLLF